jgi:tripartite-type tricarboxylate transporter receptor subunit TctC
MAVLIVLCLCCAGLVMPSLGIRDVGAQDYPTKPIRFIVPYPPGGPTDVIARLIGQKLYESTGQQIIVDNRGGGASVVGTELAARAAPDGYTMLFGTFGFAITPALHRDLPYDSLRDFAPVSLMAAGILVLVVHPTMPVKSVKELIALAKAKPGQLNYSSTGGGSSSSLGGMLFKSATGVQMTEVPYNGAGPGLAALVSGQVNLAFFSIVPALPFIKAGKLNVLGVSTAKRTNLLPDVPTIAEAGVPGYELTQWYGILLPGRTPPAIVAKLNSEIVRIVHRADVKEVFTAQGLEPIGNTPAEFAKHLASEVKKWSTVLKDTGTSQK